ncbi:MAG: VWA domain-containing protein, partial [Verrucomicrobiales bacterium]|nr:VWA domain-containing protein [Verrucomicrobiales bacterium]
MTFDSPAWLFMLIPLPFLALLRVWSHVSTGKGGESLVSPRLRGELIVGAAQWLRWTVFSMNLLALAFLIIALARPEWGFVESETHSEGRNVIIALDTSRSMLATDLQPDRLTRAKLAAEDIVRTLPEDRIGLIAFAGRAFLQAPLTVDHDAIIESIDQLDTEIIPRGGTNLSAPVQMALETFEEAESEESALIIFSDGEDLEGGGEIVQDLKDKANELGMVIVAIGVGTETGSIIPEPDSKGNPQPGVFVTDESGQAVRSRLDPAALQKLSAESGAGVYLTLGGSVSITGVVEKSIASLAATRLEENISRRIPKERFMWPLSIAVFLWLLAFLLPASSRSLVRAFSGQTEALDVPPPLPVRAGKSIVAIIILTLPAGHFLSAVEVESTGYRALKRNDFDQAIANYQEELRQPETEEQARWMNLGLGAAAYKAGNFELAQESFGQVLASSGATPAEIGKAQYNIGNTLFRSGEVLLGWDRSKAEGIGGPPPIPDKNLRQQVREIWEKSVEHYEAAAEIDSSNPQTAKNIEAVKKHLEYLDQMDEQEKQQEEQEKEKEKEKKEEEEKEEEKEDEKEEEKEDQDQNDQNQDQQDQNQNQDPNQQNQDQDDKGEQEPQDQDGKGQDPQNQDQQDQNQDGKNDPQDQQNQDGKGQQ